MTRATDTPTSPVSSALDLRPNQQVETTAPDSIARPRGLRPRSMSVELLGENVELIGSSGKKCARPATKLEKDLIEKLIAMESLAASLNSKVIRLESEQSANGAGK